MAGPAPIFFYFLGIILGLAGLTVLLLGLAGAGLTLAYNYRVEDFMLAAMILVGATSVGVVLIYCANRAIGRGNSTPTDVP
jgi:hypothetical protein